MKKLIKIILFIAVVALLVVGGIKKIKSARAEDKAQPLPKVYPLMVKTTVAKITHVTLTLPYLAEVKNDENVVLSSRLSAKVMMVKKSGERVKKGEFVAKLDTSDLDANIKSVEISLKNLLNTHRRTQKLFKVKGASIEQLQKEETNISVLKAKLENLKTQKSYADITSPVDGVIAKSYVSKGSMAMPGKPLVAISSKEGYYLLLRVPPTTDVKAVKFQSRFYKVMPLKTTFKGLSEYKAYLGKSNLNEGDRVEVQVVVFYDKALLVPFEAVLNRDGKSYILIQEKNKAVPKEIKVVSSGEQGVVIPKEFAGKTLVVAKPDILLKLVSGHILEVER